MSSRADYLSKYLSGSNEKSKSKSSKNKDKSKRKDKNAELTNIVVHGQLSASSEPSSQVPINALDDDNDEYSPVQVSVATPKTPNKGFKRIDNGKISKVEPIPPQDHASDEPNIRDLNQTVYRDSSGRIIDLEAKRKELQTLKEKEIEEKRLQEQQINTGDMDRIRLAQDVEKEKKSTRFDYSKTDREYVEHMTKKEQFDDPLKSFADKPVVPTSEVNASGRPVYAKGAHPTNRFQIKAGHFWDGIDRSNGFEDRLVQKREEAQVTKINQKAFQESYTEYDFD